MNYILKKDTPDCKKGARFSLSDDRMYYICREVSLDSPAAIFTKKLVENSPDWFKQEELLDKNKVLRGLIEKICKETTADCIPEFSTETRPEDFYLLTTAKIKLNDSYYIKHTIKYDSRKSVTDAETEAMEFLLFLMINQYFNQITKIKPVNPSKQ